MTGFSGDLAFMKQGSYSGTSPTERIQWPLQIVTRRSHFCGPYSEPTDWVAIFLRSYERSPVAQRVGPVSWVETERLQRWLRAMNAGGASARGCFRCLLCPRHLRTRLSANTASSNPYEPVIKP